MRGHAADQEVEHVLALFAGGSHRGHHTFSEALAAFTLAACPWLEAELTFCARVNDVPRERTTRLWRFPVTRPATHVRATLNYLLYEGVRPQLFMSRESGAQPESTIKSQPLQVDIHNARAQVQAPTLDRNGFELRAHESKVLDFADDEQVTGLYYQECEALLKRATGADKVVIFDHTRRLDAPGSGRFVPPVRGVHCDQTFVSGRRRLREHLSSAEAERRLQGRSAIINVWRPIVEPLLSAPLALCDARSIAPDDVVTADFIYPDKGPTKRSTCSCSRASINAQAMRARCWMPRPKQRTGSAC